MVVIDKFRDLAESISFIFRSNETRTRGCAEGAPDWINSGHEHESVSVLAANL